MAYNIIVLLFKKKRYKYICDTPKKSTKKLGVNGLPDSKSLNFGTDIIIGTFYMCSVNEPNGNNVLSTTSYVIIQKWTILAPICVPMNTYNVIGEILTLRCFSDSDPTVITTWKSGSGQVLSTELDIKSRYITHNFTVTKEDHLAKFVCESRRSGTNEIRRCPIGPITVNYKPEINITQTSPLEFHCTAEARPPVNEIHWIVGSSIPEDSFTISNNVLRITEPLKVDYEMNITCKAQNSIGKGTKTLNISVSNNQDEEDGNDSISVVIIVVVSVLFCVVTVFVIVSFCLYKSKQNQMLTTDYDDTIVDQRLSKEEDGYQIPIKTIRDHYQSLKMDDESMNTKEDEKVGQIVEVTSSTATYVNALPDINNRNPCRIQEIDDDGTYLELEDDNLDF